MKRLLFSIALSFMMILYVVFCLVARRSEGNLILAIPANYFLLMCTLYARILTVLIASMSIYILTLLLSIKPQISLANNTVQTSQLMTASMSGSLFKVLSSSKANKLPWTGWCILILILTTQLPTLWDIIMHTAADSIKVMQITGTKSTSQSLVLKDYCSLDPDTCTVYNAATSEGLRDAALTARVLKGNDTNLEITDINDAKVLRMRIPSDAANIVYNGYAISSKCVSETTKCNLHYGAAGSGSYSCPDENGVITGYVSGNSMNITVINTKSGHIGTRQSSPGEGILVEISIVSQGNNFDEEMITLFRGNVANLMRCTIHVYKAINIINNGIATVKLDARLDDSLTNYIVATPIRFQSNNMYSDISGVQAQGSTDILLKSVASSLSMYAAAGLASGVDTHGVSETYQSGIPTEGTAIAIWGIALCSLIIGLLTIIISASLLLYKRSTRIFSVNIKGQRVSSARSMARWLVSTTPLIYDMIRNPDWNACNESIIKQEDFLNTKDMSVGFHNNHVGLANKNELKMPNGELAL